MGLNRELMKIAQDKLAFDMDSIREWIYGKPKPATEVAPVEQKTWKDRLGRSLAQGAGGLMGVGMYDNPPTTASVAGSLAAGAGGLAGGEAYESGRPAPPASPAPATPAPAVPAAKPPVLPPGQPPKMAALNPTLLKMAQAKLAFYQGFGHDALGVAGATMGRIGSQMTGGSRMDREMADERGWQAGRGWADSLFGQQQSKQQPPTIVPQALGQAGSSQYAKLPGRIGGPSATTAPPNPGVTANPIAKPSRYAGTAANRGVRQSVVNPAAPQAPSGGINSSANPAAKATGQAASGSGFPGPLSGQQPKAASLNPTLIKMATARSLRDQIS